MPIDELLAAFDAARARHTAASMAFKANPSEENLLACFAAFDATQNAFAEYARDKPSMRPLVRLGELAIELREFGL